MSRVFRPAVRRADLAPLRFHDLRHTHAALMVAAGAHPKLLQAQLGHTSIASKTAASILRQAGLKQ
jgi:integrase